MAATQKVRFATHVLLSIARARRRGRGALPLCCARDAPRTRLSGAHLPLASPARICSHSSPRNHRLVLYTVLRWKRERRGQGAPRSDTDACNAHPKPPLPLLLSCLQAPSLALTRRPQQGGAYWTVSFGVCTRLGLTCRECRAPLFKGQRIAARDGRKIRLTYHDECFSGDADPRTQLNASSAEGRLPQACFTQQAPAHKGRGKWSTSYGLVPAPAGTPTKARVVSTPEPAQRPARAGGDGSTRAQAMRGPGGRRPATPQWR